MPGTRLALSVISLTSSTDRRARVTDNLSDCSLSWSFLDATTPDDHSDLMSDLDGQRDHFGRVLTPGEVACFRSHMRALDAFDADPGLDWLLVMEDDVWIDTDFPFERLVDALDGWGIGFLRLFARDLKPALPRYRFGERQILYVTTDPYGAQGYLMSRETAARFRAHVTRILRPVDDEMSRFWENGLDLHMMFPFPMVERHGPSTLEDDREGTKAQSPGTSRAFKVNRIRDAIAKRAYLTYRRSRFAKDRIVVKKR